jgi:hypothetical protein
MGGFMPAIHVNNVDIQVYEQQYTSPTLHVQNTDGKIYHAIVIPQGGELFDASEKLVYSNAADDLLDSNGAINECQPVTLDAGMYRVELRGGAGGKQSRCRSGLGTTNPVANTVSQIFKLPTQTTVYAFRGGDGNDSPTVTGHQIPGGGASGVDSMLVIDDHAIVGVGAPSSQCMDALFAAFPFGGRAIRFYCQSTPAGTYSIENIRSTHSYLQTTYVCGGGGGGAPNGLGGGAVSNTKFKATAGTNATSDGGGNGGDAENLMGDSQTQNTARGGIGGKNVTYECAGHTAVSYGGGGGGATCALALPSTCESLGVWCYSDCADGGNGASGSTGKSDTSYVKIYKIG